MYENTNSLQVVHFNKFCKRFSNNISLMCLERNTKEMPEVANNKMFKISSHASYPCTV